MVSKLLLLYLVFDCEIGVSNHFVVSSLVPSSFGFLWIMSSVGESGDIGIADVAVRLILRSWSATAFRGLSGRGEGAGLRDSGVDAGRNVVFSSGTGGG
jgi:hypothetical protein